MAEENIPPIKVRLAVDRLDTNLFGTPEVQIRFYAPGEEISNQGDFLRYFTAYLRT